VLRGPQSGLYGSNALAGVVSVITRGGGDGGAVELSAEAGSYDTRQVAVAARGGDSGRHGALNLAYRESFLDASPTGNEQDGDENLSFAGRGRIAVSDLLTLDGAFRLVDRRVASDDQDFLTGAIVDAPSVADYDDAQLSAGATWTGGRWRTALDGSRYVGESAARDAFGLSRSRTQRDQLSFASTVDFAAGPAGVAHSLTGFVQHKDESYRDLSNSSAGELERGVLGIGVEYRGEYRDRLFFSGTVRDDANDGFEDATTYRTTLAFLLDDRTRLHASYGVGVTNPTFIEQFGFGFAWVGNHDLVPEEATGWDLGWERRFADGRLTFDATYFRADLENEIEFAPPFFDRSRNREGVSKRSGVELALRGGLTDRLGLDAAFTYTDAEDPPPDEPAEEVRRPPRMASVDFSYALDGGRVRLHAGAVYNGRMLDVDPSLGFAKGPVSSYTLVSAGGSFSVGERLEVFARVENLLDAPYEEVIGYATPGRGVLAGFRWRVAAAASGAR
jgi:vitamin B12 transporter